MPGPKFGALGMTFTVVRAMQAISLIAIIGMTSNFIQEMVAANQVPHQVLVGTLSVVCTLWLLYISITNYIANAFPRLASHSSTSEYPIFFILTACSPSSSQSASIASS